MDSKDELKEIDIKNRTCYYFDDAMAVSGISFKDFFIKGGIAKKHFNL